MKNIDLVAERIIKAIKNNEKIFIFSDADFDGLSSGIILYKYLLNFTDNLQLQYVERSIGHGTQYIIDQIPDDINLYIAVDSSSNDIEEMKQLTDNGIDCLIIDHHTITDDNPFATIVNPQQEGCLYPNKNSSGGLLVWKLCSVLDDYMTTYYSNDFLDLAGFSLAADMMSMREMENRYFFKNALKNVRHEGLKALFIALNKEIKNLYANDFVYGVSPAITAATRADNIQLAINLLMCNKESPEIPKLVKELIKVNEKRKEIQALALRRLKPTINSENNCIIVHDSAIGKGFNGLVAQDLSKYYNKPSIVLGNGTDDDTYAGSFRSVDDFPMLDLLTQCKYPTFAAGHQGAGGTGVKISKMDNLQEELNEELEYHTFDDSLFYDLEFNVNEIDEKLIKYIADFYRVTGTGFKDGKFLIKGLFISHKKPMGSLGNTTRIDCDSLVLMKFKADEDFYDSVPVFTDVEAVGTLNVNEFKKYNRQKKRYEVEKTNQLFIEDYREKI
ncbi:DHH family phosphoesterase [Paenibacillus sp. FSL H3-0333]|uniref:DHH family phosphoesterase n=1 Tax=Paenibacillus sp. FSL H3-0333 TaxID=2921373 RepID=UPI0030F708D6